ncbi:hypothetical protein Pla175_25030 [Pirellulimonas nuda]|uniref:Uncharacterized protein n=1 Tax=Pirellulimonas nuda TaxID=2528009 RepID=A0A518DCA9_9BACT|nr:hypothetical protein Pla175_25030 [Pirellulimonas nuda]
MLRILIGVCLLLSTTKPSAAADNDSRLLSTDWLTPSLEINSLWTNVCRVELTINDEEVDGPCGTMILYTGTPSFNLFGALLTNPMRTTACQG